MNKRELRGAEGRPIRPLLRRLAAPQDAVLRFGAVLRCGGSHPETTMPRQDPLRNHRFRIEIDGIASGAFAEVTIGPTTTAVIEYRDGSDPAHVRKLPGLTTYGNVTLRSGVTSSLDLFNWHSQVVRGETAGFRKNLSIVVLDDDGRDVARFNVAAAWPVKYDPGDLNATGNDVFIELIELVNEGIERVS
jgi:phage tail-like protein